jgi:chromosome segregation ATPase
VLLAGALAPLGLAQSDGSDATTLAAILAELRSIHEEVRAAQTTQVLLVEWQLEQGMVNRAADRVEDARQKLIQFQTDQKLAAARLSEAQDHLDAAPDPAGQAHWKEEVERLQGNVTAMTAEVQASSSALYDLQAKLRNAEDDLNNTQDQLNALIKKQGPAPTAPLTK